MEPELCVNPQRKQPHHHLHHHQQQQQQQRVSSSQDELVLKCPSAKQLKPPSVPVELQSNHKDETAVCTGHLLGEWAVHSPHTFCFTEKKFGRSHRREEAVAQFRPEPDMVHMWP
ncbi:unnamed protein product [Pleuronectes platessa]|uniref:Uncharacterized protein n=1 Tax=Pleuronectes platessa TaxID=8262 RepID=A0A9N7W5E7_PLEPL|nr:unnamed protein product [Pleuronectes platessa]